MKESVKRGLIVCAQLAVLIGGSWLGYRCCGFTPDDLFSVAVPAALGFCARLFLRAGLPAALTGVSIYPAFTVWNTVRYHSEHGFDHTMLGEPRNITFHVPATPDLLRETARLEAKYSIAPAAIAGLAGWLLAALYLKLRARSKQSSA